MSDTSRIQKLAAAYLAARNNGNLEIAQILDLSPGHVSRLLRECTSEGILKSPVFDEAGVSNDELAALRQLTDAWQLKEKIQNLTAEGLPQIRRIRVYGSDSTKEDIKNLRLRNASFGRQIANDVAELILRSRHCMVAWGGMIGAIVDEMRRSMSGRKPLKRRIDFFPTCGDPFGVFNARTSPSALCAELDSIVNGSTTSHEFSLAGIPAVIPSVPGQFGSPQDVEVMRRFCDLSVAYKRIFGEGREREKVDCILTGVGTFARGSRSAQARFGLYTQKCLNLWGVDPDWASEYVRGDIAGAFIEKPNLTDKQRQHVAEKTSLWLGVKLEDFRRCAMKAEGSKKSKKPGVLVAAVGTKDLARVIFDCCTRLGIITELFIDYSMQGHLEEICAKESKTAMTTTRKD